jgi:hypothetical protein
MHWSLPDVWALPVDLYDELIAMLNDEAEANDEHGA